MNSKKLPVDILKVLRIKAVYAVIQHGFTQKKAGEVFGLSQTSMSKYVRAYKMCGVKSFEYARRGVLPHTGTLLTKEQEDSLIKDILSQTPDELGLEYSLWTSKVVQHYLQIKYSITYSERGIRILMNRLGFSSQKPIKLAYQRNPDKIKVWLDDVYPKIKVRAIQEGARIYWGDEMGIHSTDNRGSTYGLVGKTPAIQKSGSSI